MFTTALNWIRAAAEFCEMLIELTLISLVMVAAVLTCLAIFSLRIAVRFVPRRDEVATLFAIALGPFAHKVAANVGSGSPIPPSPTTWGQKGQKNEPSTIKLAEATADGGVAVVEAVAEEEAYW